MGEPLHDRILPQVVASVGRLTTNTNTRNKQVASRVGKHVLGKFLPFFELLPAAFLCLVAVWEIQTIAHAGNDTGTDSEWSSAARMIESKWKVGDLIVFAPRWTDPLGRRELGHLLTIDDAARPDGDRYAIIWELSIRGAQAPETRGRKLEWSGHSGAVSIKKWVAPPAIVVTDFSSALSAASVEGRAVKPPSRSLEEVGFEPHRCVLTIPQADKSVGIHYHGVELGARLVGYVGLADVFTRRDIRAPGRLDIKIDGRSVLSRTVGVDDGWKRFEIETSPTISADVVVRISAIGPTSRNRRVCFVLEARQ